MIKVKIKLFTKVCQAILNESSKWVISFLKGAYTWDDIDSNSHSGWVIWMLIGVFTE